MAAGIRCADNNHLYALHTHSNALMETSSQTHPPVVLSMMLHCNRLNSNANT